MKPYKAFTIRDWGGLNEDENPSALRPEELVETLNCSRLGTSLGTRPGVNREATGGDYVDVIASGGTNSVVKGLFHYSTTADFARGTVLAVSGSKLFTDDTTAKTVGTGADLHVSADNVQCFAQYRGDVFFTGYTPGASSQPTFHYWDGSAGTFIGVAILDSTATSAEAAKYVLSKWGYVFLAGFNPTANDNAANPMNVRFNNLTADATAVASWPAGNTIGTGAGIGHLGGLKEYGDEFITGLAEFQDNEGDWLLILTNRRLVAVLHAWDANTFNAFKVHSAIANGCVHQNAYVNLGLDYGDAVYLSEHGIHSVRQSQQYGAREDTFLSWKIRRTFETLNPARLPQAVGGYDQAEGYVLFAVSTGSSSSHDMILCLDVRDKQALTADQARWYIWKLAGTEKIASMTQARDPNGKMRLYVGGTLGSVGYWSRKAYTDFASGFSVKWTGKHEDFNAPMVEKVLGDMMVDVQPGGDHSNPRW